MSIQAQTSLLARVTGRPVKLALTREESVRLHPKRHPIRMTYTVGCDADGMLTAVKARMVGDSGAYASVGSKAVLERAAGHSCGAYDVVNVDVQAIAAYTNNVPCGAFRGFGANQAQFAMEGAMDLLAAKLGMDRWEFRFKNALEVGHTFASGQVFEKSTSVSQEDAPRRRSRTTTPPAPLGRPWGSPAMGSRTAASATARWSGARSGWWSIRRRR